MPCAFLVYKSSSHSNHSASSGLSYFNPSFQRIVLIGRQIVPENKVNMCPRRARVAVRLSTRILVWGDVVTAWDPYIASPKGGMPIPIGSLLASG